MIEDEDVALVVRALAVYEGRRLMGPTIFAAPFRPGLLVKHCV